MSTNNQLTREEALKKVAEVLEEALNEYEMLEKSEEELEKMDIEMAEDPSRPLAGATPEAAPAEAEDEEKEEDEDKEKDDEENSPEASEQQDEEQEESKDDSEEKEEDEDKSDEALKSEFAHLARIMHRRGLLNEDIVGDREVKKSEKAGSKQEAGKSESQVESLRKSFDSEIAELKKAVATMADTINKIASQPAPRKGVSGYAPLKKSEEGTDQPLQKAQVIDKLLDLKKSGDRRVTTALINRVETNRFNSADLEFIKGILG